MALDSRNKLRKLRSGRLPTVVSAKIPRAKDASSSSRVTSNGDPGTLGKTPLHEIDWTHMSRWLTHIAASQEEKPKLSGSECCAVASRVTRSTNRAACREEGLQTEGEPREGTTSPERGRKPPRGVPPRAFFPRIVAELPLGLRSGAGNFETIHIPPRSCEGGETGGGFCKTHAERGGGSFVGRTAEEQLSQLRREVSQVSNSVEPEARRSAEVPREASGELRGFPAGLTVPDKRPPSTRARGLPRPRAMSDPPAAGRPRSHSEESASSNLSSSSSSQQRRAPSPAVPSFRFRRGASSRSSKDLTDELGPGGAVDVALYKEGVPKRQQGELQEAGRLGDAARDPYEGPSHTTTEDYAVRGGEAEEVDLEGPSAGAGPSLVAGGIARPDEDGEFVSSRIVPVRRRFFRRAWLAFGSEGRSSDTSFRFSPLRNASSPRRRTVEHIGTLVDGDALDRSPLDDDDGDSDGTPDGGGGGGGGQKLLTPIVEVRTPTDTPGTAARESVPLAPPGAFPAPPLDRPSPARRVARDPSERISIGRPGMGSDWPPSVDRFMLGRDPTERFGPGGALALGAAAGAARADEENQGDDREPASHDSLAADNGIPPRRRRRRRALVCLAALLALLAVVLGAVLGTRSAASKKGEPSRNVDGGEAPATAASEAGDDAAAAGYAGGLRSSR
ncbi:hypothetical protein THAOC_28753 [Thalassiosira oceanica]|uniref:Uncharacterized protein n=1 Tax=Thalassiosira oceanica TaxID=159749 RepID=K0RFI2_THAOC|nr:hypothetical protein THAOC_28753 [Thalassiosira oceanica]|eukprot:EJK52020.1 hypothetical protein THAOC_28753 [Thalassiosira oceanica]